jgi:hypothetical protein
MGDRQRVDELEGSEIASTVKEYLQGQIQEIRAAKKRLAALEGQLAGYDMIKIKDAESMYNTFRRTIKNLSQ